MCMELADPLTCLKYGFPNSPHSPFLQLSPNPGGHWEEESRSKAALLLRAIFSRSSGDRGVLGGVDGSESTAESFGFFCKILV